MKARRIIGAGIGALAVVAGLSGVPLAAAGASDPPPPVHCPAATRHLGEVAVLALGRLEVIDLATCRAVARPGLVPASPSGLDAPAGVVRFSPDGRWLAASPVGGTPTVLPAAGPALQTASPRRVLGGGIVSWSWARRGDGLLGLTARGTVTERPAGGTGETMEVGTGAPASSLVVSQSGGGLAVDASRCATSPRSAAPLGELRTIEVGSHRASIAAPLTQAGHYLTLASASPDGRWLLAWSATMCSGSLAADGWPLEAFRSGAGAAAGSGAQPVRAVRTMLLYDDFLTWCGHTLVAAAGPDRFTGAGSRLVATAPPDWRARTIAPAGRLSWVSPACAPSGRWLAAAAGPGNAPGRFGAEHRSIWVVRPDGRVVRRLTDPPAGWTDESPRVSRDGRWVLFVRTRVTPSASQNTLELIRADGTGQPIAEFQFASSDVSYYDHFRWADEVAWSDAG